MLKKIKIYIMLCIGGCFLFLLPLSVHAADRIHIPDRAVRSGKSVYYAIGNDGEGYIYRYNIPSKKKNIILRKRCKHLSVKEKYIYFTIDNYNGSDGCDQYVYRMKNDGSHLMKLANGYSPVIIGKNIYYIGVIKEKNVFGTLEDNETAGIYRMNLNGSRKKCIYSFKKSIYFTSLYSLSGNRLILADRNEFKSIEISGKKIRIEPYLFNKNICMNTSFYRSIDNKNPICNNHKEYRFSATSNKLYRIKGNKRKIIGVFKKGTSIQKIIDLDGYLFIVTEGGYPHSYANVYILNHNGKEKKLVYHFILAGGSW